MRENTRNGLAMPEVQGTYIMMFSPKHVELNVESLVPMPENEEINGPLLFDDRHKLLTSSFKQFGQNKYVIVYPGENGQHSIIDGVRCLHAAKAAGFTHLSCIVLDVDKHRAFEIMQILNSGSRKVTYAMKAKKLELLEKHAKLYLKENGSGENEESKLTVRQYMGSILQMSERYVSDFKVICAHPDKKTLLDNMDQKFWTFNKAAKVARNKNTKVSSLKKEIARGKKDESACEDCPRRNKFKEEITNYGDVNEEESEVSNA